MDQKKHDIQLARERARAAKLEMKREEAAKGTKSKSSTPSTPSSSRGSPSALGSRGSPSALGSRGSNRDSMRDEGRDSMRASGRVSRDGVKVQPLRVSKTDNLAEKPKPMSRSTTGLTPRDEITPAAKLEIKRLHDMVATEREKVKDLELKLQASKEDSQHHQREAVKSQETLQRERVLWERKLKQLEEAASGDGRPSHRGQEGGQGTSMEFRTALVGLAKQAKSLREGKQGLAAEMIKLKQGVQEVGMLRDTLVDLLFLREEELQDDSLLFGEDGSYG